jgi:histidine ammonia-lyase
VYASIVELEAESHTKNPYVAEMYMVALEGNFTAQYHKLKVDMLE